MYILGIPGSVLLGYADYGSAAVLLLYLLYRVFLGRASGLRGMTAYMLASVVSGTPLMWASLHYGPRSPQYAVSYWAVSLIIVFAAFLLIGSFFRRACSDGVHPIWRYVRLMLVLVFVLTGAVSYLAFSLRHAHFFPYFVIEFHQDLYFVCLVLTTMLYLLLQHFESADDQLGLLVCGLGLGYAGPAASLALYRVAGGSALYGEAAGYLIPLCEIAMVSIWFYAAARVPKPVSATEARRAREVMPVQALARI